MDRLLGPLSAHVERAAKLRQLLVERVRDGAGVELRHVAAFHISGLFLADFYEFVESGPEVHRMERNHHLAAVDAGHFSGNLRVGQIDGIAHADGPVLHLLGARPFLRRLFPMDGDDGLDRFRLGLLNMFDFLLHLLLEGLHLLAGRLGFLRVGLRLLDFADSVLDDLVRAIDNAVGLVLGLGENLLPLFVELREPVGVFGF